MTIEQIRPTSHTGTGGEPVAPGPAAGGPPVGSTDDPAPVAAPAGEGAARRGRRRVAAVVVGVLGLLALVGGLALAFVPYDRGLVGYLEGSRTIVDSECAAPVAAAFGSSDRTLADGSTWSDGAPCQRSATARLVLGGLLAVTGVAALGGAARSRRAGGDTSPRR